MHYLVLLHKLVSRVELIPPKHIAPHQEKVSHPHTLSVDMKVASGNLVAMGVFVA